MNRCGSRWLAARGTHDRHYKQEYAFHKRSIWRGGCDWSCTGKYGTGGPNGHRASVGRESGQASGVWSLLCTRPLDPPHESRADFGFALRLCASVGFWRAWPSVLNEILFVGHTSYTSHTHHNRPACQQASMPGTGPRCNQNEWHRTHASGLKAWACSAPPPLVPPSRMAADRWRRPRLRPSLIFAGMSAPPTLQRP